MILSSVEDTFSYKGRDYSIGQKILATSCSEYAGLYGTIIEIRDGADKETENSTPDIYCEFEPPTKTSDILRLESVFSALYQQQKPIADIALDIVIMSPEMVEPIDI